MKYAIIGDFHGTELKDLDTALDYENPDTIICTGDFDQTKTVHQFMDLEKKYKDAGKKVIKVPGNHDHAILNNLPITSGALLMQGKTIR
ncbi:MAG: metallophosphoesterase, partial [Candidatus Marinimicrobia bacterium]|nr:metallophosphoesterase [Candidatus Neomarinimicrobiota bacterium]